MLAEGPVGLLFPLLESVAHILLQPLLLRSVSHMDERMLRYDQLPPCDPSGSAHPLSVGHRTNMGTLIACQSLALSAHHGNAHYGEGRDAKLTNWTITHAHTGAKLLCTHKQTV